METNEQLKADLIARAEVGILEVIEHVQALAEGDLKGLEQVVLSACLSVGRRWLEQIMNQPRQASRPAARREGACGHHQRLVGGRAKEVLTLMGKVTFRRPYYQCLRQTEGQQVQQAATCSGGEAPQDQLWGVGPHRTSPGVQKLVSMLCASMTLEEATTVFESFLPLAISARQALNLLLPVGEQLRKKEDERVHQMQQEAAHKQSRLASASPDQQEDLRRMYIEMDGVLLRLRRGSVPMEEQEVQREGDVYREIKVGAVFAASRGRRRSELAESTFVDEAGPLHYVARRTTAETFGTYLYALAQHCGVERARQVVVLGDGAHWIWRLAQEHFPKAVEIVDIWHAREHVWKVAHAAFGRSTAKASAWAKHACDLLSEGHIDDLVCLIEKLPPVAPELGMSRSVPEIEADYFRSNAERMRYPRFRQQGMHIGSGIAEAACKTVVSTRAKRSGMRWTPAGLDAVLALRTAVLNGTYDQFWEGRPHLVA